MSKSAKLGTASRFGPLWTRWLQRRLPATDRVLLGRSRLFIFPAREGGLFLVLLVIMLLTGINYQNSLVYLLTFLLGTLFYIGIVQTHDNLSGLELALAGTDEGYAGAPLSFSLRLKATDGSDRPAVEIALGETIRVAHVSTGVNEEVSLAFTPARRGLVPIPRIRIETRYPMGLFRAWSYLRLESHVMVYPRLIAPTAKPAAAGEGEDSQHQRLGTAVSDELLLRPYRPGDALARVQWKRFAKAQQMVTASPEPASTDSRWLDYDDFPGIEPELRLSYLSWLVDDAHGKDQAFGLRLPGAALAPARGGEQRRSALRMLALYGQEHS